MRLLTGLVVRFLAIASLCLVMSAAWVLIDSHRSIQDEAAASADRVVRVLQSHLWLGSADATARLASPNWETPATLRDIAPAICVAFIPPNSDPRRLCSGWSGSPRSAPSWFARFYDGTFGTSTPVSRPLIVQRREAGKIVASPSPEAAMQQAWQTVTLVTGVVCATVLCFSVLAFLVLGHALLPAVTIIRNLQRLGRGETDIERTHFRAPEFRLIAEAVKDLADRLAQTGAERLRLTQQLLQVQEDERRMLARDMHDEFGQCLTAAGALAASIEMGAAERQDLASDAEAIGRIVERMMSTLRSTLGRLRPPDFDDLGLEASLGVLIANWNGQPGPRAAFSLDVRRDLATVPAPAALSIYRIVQECLTNAVRHGRPRSVCVRLSTDNDRHDTVSVVVEDDGGGDPAQIANASGFGILGIRERVAALGGRLAIGRAAGGIRIAAVIPLSPALSIEAA